MEEFSDEVCEVADEVEQKRFGESGVMGEPSRRRADETADETDERRADEYDDERDDAFDDVQRHDVVDADHAELVEHPVQHLHTTPRRCTLQRLQRPRYGLLTTAVVPS